MGLSPAQALRRWLTEHDSTVDELGRHSRLDPAELKGILAGTTPVNSARADRLQRGTGIKAAVWRGLQDTVDAMDPLPDLSLVATAVRHELWEGVLAVLDEPSVDARRLCSPPGGLRTAALPLPLVVGSMPVGAVDTVAIDGNLVTGSGWLVTDAVRASGCRQLADVLLSDGHVAVGIRVDEMLMTELLSEDMGVVAVCEDWRLRSVSLCVDGAAWPQARIALVKPQTELW